MVQTASKSRDSGEIQPLLQLLTRARPPLYALLDAARDPAILPLLDASGTPSTCLFEGPQAETLASHAPHLVRLAPTDPALPALVKHGWGRSWGVYLTSDGPPEALLAQLRGNLWVRDPDGNKLYFRFYDPRVLHTALAAMDPREVADFMGPVSSYLIETEAPGVMQVWAREGAGVHVARVLVGP